MADRGVLYVATGMKWVREAVASATSLRSWHPDIPILLVTDHVDAVPAGLFTTVERVEDRPWVASEAKVDAVAKSPFERTLYIDTDTYVCGDLTPLFDVLDRFDIAAVPVPTRTYRKPGHMPGHHVPAAFMAFNGGVLAYRRNEKTAALFDDWWQLYQEDKAHGSKPRDQPCLWVALWRSECDILAVPAEYNLHVLHYPLTAAGRVRIMHGRVYDPVRYSRWLNDDERPRVRHPLIGRTVDRVLARAHRRWSGA